MPNVSSVPTVPLAYGTPSQVQAGGMGVLPNTSPCVVPFLSSAYLFFTGSGSDGIYMTTSDTNDDETITWGQVAQILAPDALYIGATSPAAVVNLSPIPRLFLFYTGNVQTNHFGIFVTTTDGQGWTEQSQLIPLGQQWVNILGTTSPCALVVDNLIHLYYSGIEMDGIYTLVATTSSPGADSQSWETPVRVAAEDGQPMNILRGTSPSALLFEDTYYLFFTVAEGASSTIAPNSLTSTSDSDSNSISYVTSLDGVNWNEAQSVPVATTVAQGASPTAFVQGSTLYLFWFSSNGVQGTATFDGQNWEPVSPLTTSFERSSVSAVLLNHQPTLFWTVVPTPGASYCKVNSSPFVALQSLTYTSFSEMAQLLAVNRQEVTIDLDNADASDLLTSSIPGFDGDPTKIELAVLQNSSVTVGGQSSAGQPYIALVPSGASDAEPGELVVGTAEPYYMKVISAAAMSAFFSYYIISIFRCGNGRCYVRFMYQI